MGKTQKWLLFIIVNIFFLTNYSCAQEKNNGLIKITETVINYKSKNKSIDNNLKPIGFVNDNVLYEKLNYNDWEVKFYKLNENSLNLEQTFLNINLSGRLFDFSAKDDYIFYSKSLFGVGDDEGFNQLILYYNMKLYILDSISNTDKKIHSNFSTDGKFLIVNSLIESKDYYNPLQDDRFMVYDLDSIREDKIKKSYIHCPLCGNGHLVGNDLFFTKAEEVNEFNNEFGQMNIYKAPRGRLQDSIKIAAFSEILAISPDGKYILGTRHFDLPNSPCAIFDVENKKYQLILGRNYSKAHAFYSYKEKKFAFDFGGKIVYIEFPKKYPFDALRKDNPDIPKWSNKEFYKQFEQAPFEDQ